MDQQVHVVANTQELQHSKGNFMQMTGHYLGMEVTLSRVIATWSCHIDRFERQYDKASARQRIFGADIVEIIHKRVQVFLHS